MAYRLHGFVRLSTTTTRSIPVSGSFGNPMGKGRHLSLSPADQDIDYRRTQRLTQRVFPSGTFTLTVTLSPRLPVDNGIDIWLPALPAPEHPVLRRALPSQPAPDARRRPTKR